MCLLACIFPFKNASYICSKKYKCFKWCLKPQQRGISAKQFFKLLRMMNTRRVWYQGYNH